MHSTSEAQLDEDFVRNIKEGLTMSQKRVNPKYLYDTTGSQLFEAICRQPEYYPWRIESAILSRHSSEIVRMHGKKKISIIELGSGSSSKTRILLKKVLSRQPSLYYFPVDVSQAMLRETIDNLSADFSSLRIIGICSDYLEGIDKANILIAADRKIPVEKLIIFLGSSIGNFEPNESVAFLRNLRSKMGQNDQLLLGIDLYKDEKVLEAAYNDREGITARFNLNILTRINRELRGEFNLDSFVHRAFYNSSYKRIEMHIVSTRDQQVYVGRLDQTFRFFKNETIHTENSYKYSDEEIVQMAADSQFVVERIFVDEKKWFCVAVLSLA
ncbi:MAG TPA: L-histidine N(alpha)-methyltransferase [Candidatus Nitrosopolaris sp.]|nr:L-histidine N(alpha)-methyltransferase [Candidatus Nitrosopolaris sp.]